MKALKLITKAHEPGHLYDEIVAAVPELAPTPTGPDGRLEARVVIEQHGNGRLRLHVPDDADDDVIEAVLAVVKAHKKREPEAPVDPRAEALEQLQQIARRENPEVRIPESDMARLVLTALGEDA